MRALVPIARNRRTHNLENIFFRREMNPVSMTFATVAFADRRLKDVAKNRRTHLFRG